MISPGGPPPLGSRSKPVATHLRHLSAQKGSCWLPLGPSFSWVCFVINFFIEFYAKMTSVWAQTCAKKLTKSQKCETYDFCIPSTRKPQTWVSKGAKASPKSGLESVQILDNFFDGFWYHFGPPNAPKIAQKVVLKSIKNRVAFLGAWGGGFAVPRPGHCRGQPSG